MMGFCQREILQQYFMPKNSLFSIAFVIHSTNNSQTDQDAATSKEEEEDAVAAEEEEEAAAAEARATWPTTKDRFWNSKIQ
jgi:hypothetical protein